MDPQDLSPQPRWTLSPDGEIYEAPLCCERETAIATGFALYDGEPFYMARCELPPAPEGYFDAESWLETVSCQDDYMGDHAENWDNSTKEQRDELTKEVQAVMAAWLDRHNLRPTFWNAHDPERIGAKAPDLTAIQE